MLFAVTFLLLLLFVSQQLTTINGECPDDSIVEPCFCVLAVPSHSYFLYNDPNPETIITHQKSIVCEDIIDSSFDLATIFARLATNLTDDQFSFDTFLLANSSVRHIPSNVFGPVKFTTLMFEENRFLTNIDLDAFAASNDQVEIFETLNTNLSNSDDIFAMLRQFGNLRRLSMHNDRFTTIPAYAFNQTKLVQIWLGLENQRTSEPIESIGAFAFSNLPNLSLIRISSPVLSQIDADAFAQIDPSNSTDLLYIYLTGSKLNSRTFPMTSFDRPVRLRFFFTSISYLDESIFRPFLLSHPLSSIDLHYSNQLFECDCRSAWIQFEYNQGENRVTGYPCWSIDFRHCQTTRSSSPPTIN